MGKFTLDALKSKADAVASNDLLATISGGTENACHPCDECEDNLDATGGQAVITGWIHLIFH